MSRYPECVFEPGNAADKPAGSRFFLGETVWHPAGQQMYTVCSLSHYEKDYYQLWPVGTVCAVPTHGAYGNQLESICEEAEGKLLAA